MPKFETPQTRYAAKNIVSFTIKLNRKYDADIMEHLDAQLDKPGGKQGYIKRLIRQDMERQDG